MPTQQRLRELLRFDTEIGRFRWVNPTSYRVKAGEVAGSETNVGYRVVGVDGKRHLEHRLVWIFHFGDIPDGMDIDHINRDRLDSSPENLRVVTRSRNLLNSSAQRNSTNYSGIQETAVGRFRAAIHIKRRCTYIGTYDTAEEAHAVYVERHLALYGEDSRFHPNHVSNKPAGGVNGRCPHEVTVQRDPARGKRVAGYSTS